MLQYYFDLLVSDTPLGGAALVIEEVPVRGRCAGCAAGLEIETLSFTCPWCGGASLFSDEGDGAWAVGFRTRFSF